MQPALRHRQRAAGWAGLIVAPTAWFAAQQFGFYLTGPTCDSQHWIPPAINLLAVIMTLASAFLSFRSWKAHAESDAASDQRARFIAGVSSCIAPVFVIVMVWQGLAGFFYSGCEH